MKLHQNLLCPLSSVQGFYSDAVQLALVCGCLGVQEQPSYHCYHVPGAYADPDVPRGADFIVATDGNFSQRHRKDVGDCPEFYRPEYFLTKEYVNNVGKRIAVARGWPPRARKAAKVPDEAVDECEDGHDSGSGLTIKTNMDHYDDGGVMVLICRHDVPLFLANIDTPGEQQKYAVSLVEHLFSLLPPTATVTILYDVACVLDRSLNLVSVPLHLRILFPYRTSV